MWQWVARGNIQQIRCIPQTDRSVSLEQHEPEGQMLFHLGNVTIVCFACTSMFMIICTIACTANSYPSIT